MCQLYLSQLLVKSAAVLIVTLIFFVPLMVFLVVLFMIHEFYEMMRTRVELLVEDNLEVFNFVLENSFQSIEIFEHFETDLRISKCSNN